MDTLVWLLVMYARYFVAAFVGSAAVFGLMWLVSLLWHPRTSPGAPGAQTAAPDRTAAA